MTIAGLTPERFMTPEIGIDLFKPAALDHLGDGHLGRSASQPVGQRHSQVARAGCGAGENNGFVYR